MTPASAPAVVRASKVLSFVAENEGPQRLTDIATGAGIPLSSTSSICTALESERLLVRRPGGYELGPRIVELSHRFLAGFDPLASFSSVIASQESLNNETVQLAVLDGHDVLYLARRDAQQPFLISSAIGRRLPASCTAIGKAALALVDPSERNLPDDLPKLTKHTLTSHSELDKEIEQTAQAGFAIDDEETSEGILCMAVACSSDSGDIYGLSATVLKSRHTIELEKTVVDGLKSALDDLFPQSIRSTSPSSHHESPRQGRPTG